MFHLSKRTDDKQFISVNDADNHENLLCYMLAVSNNGAGATSISRVISVIMRTQVYLVDHPWHGHRCICLIYQYLAVWAIKITQLIPHSSDSLNKYSALIGNIIFTQLQIDANDNPLAIAIPKG